MSIIAKSIRYVTNYSSSFSLEELKNNFLNMGEEDDVLEEGEINPDDLESDDEVLDAPIEEEDVESDDEDEEDEEEDDEE